MQESVESVGEFAVSGCDATELFDAIEKSLNETSRLISMPVDFVLGVAIAPGRDDGLCPGRLDGSDQRTAVVRLSAMTARVGVASIKGVTGNLACSQDQPYGITKGVAQA